jgi:enterochelin esterase-like enzyme
MRTKLRLYLLALCLAFTLHLTAQSSAPAQRLHFRITVSKDIASTPVSGRLLVMMTSKPVHGDMLQPGYGEEAHDVWVAAQEVHDLAPGASVDFDPDTIAYPARLSTAPAGDYKVMAYLDVNHHAAYKFRNPGDLLSKLTDAPQLNPASATAPVQVTVTEIIPDQPITAPEGTELIDFVSPSLSAFWGRPIHLRGVVVLPPGYDPQKPERYPTVYMTHGYGADLHTLAGPYANRTLSHMKSGAWPKMIWVLLDESCAYGTHEFADSANNGPWGKALTTELIPHLEKQYRMDARTSGRFLTGHSSGGWATMWLQVTYPKTFGGTWSTSPDPVDFRNFTGPDLTKMPSNVYKKSDGTQWPLVRMDGKEAQSLEDLVRQELVLGDYGGQFRSFEAVFSPRDNNETPMMLFDRATGDVNPEVAKAWQKYNISLTLRENWNTLGPQLKGKIHIIVGTADTFHLDESVRLLDAELKKLGSGAKITYLEGRTHFDLYKGGVDDQIAKEMYAVARPPKSAPKKAPAKAAPSAAEAQPVAK